MIILSMYRQVWPNPIPNSNTWVHHPYDQLFDVPSDMTQSNTQFQYMGIPPPWSFCRCTIRYVPIQYPIPIHEYTTPMINYSMYCQIWPNPIPNSNTFSFILFLCSSLFSSHISKLITVLNPHISVSTTKGRRCLSGFLFSKPKTIDCAPVSPMAWHNVLFCRFPHTARWPRWPSWPSWPSWPCWPSWSSWPGWSSWPSQMIATCWPVLLLRCPHLPIPVQSLLKVGPSGGAGGFRQYNLKKHPGKILKKYPRQDLKKVPQARF